MGLTYKKSSRTLNFKEDKPTVQVLKPVRYPTITAEDLAEEIAQTQGVPKTMVLAVIEALINRLIHYMKIGHGVRMGDFGIFKPSFSAKSAETAEELDASLITRKKILFSPGKAFRTMLKNVSVQSVDEATTSGTTGSGDSSPSDGSSTSGGDTPSGDSSGGGSDGDDSSGSGSFD